MEILGPKGAKGFSNSPVIGEVYHDGRKKTTQYHSRKAYPTLRCSVLFWSLLDGIDIFVRSDSDKTSSCNSRGCFPRTRFHHILLRSLQDSFESSDESSDGYYVCAKQGSKALGWAGSKSWNIVVSQQLVVEPDHLEDAQQASHFFAILRGFVLKAIHISRDISIF